MIFLLSKEEKLSAADKKEQTVVFIIARQIGKKREDQNIQGGKHGYIFRSGYGSGQR